MNRRTTTEDSGRPTTVLAIRLRQLGDVLATLGTLRALKRAAPKYRIAFVADARYHDLLRKVEYIDLLVPEPPPISGLRGAVEYHRYVDDIRRLRAKVALDFHSNTRSAILCYLSGAPVRIGFDVRVRKRLYTDIEPRALYRNGRRVHRNSHDSAMALGRRTGIPGLVGSVENTISVDVDAIAEGKRKLIDAGVSPEKVESGDVIGLNPGNPYPAKDWPESHWVELAERLVAENHEVVVTWGPGEHRRASRIVRRASVPVRIAPALQLVEAPGFIRNLALIVTIDSGLKHLAVALGVATVTLFGPTSPHDWHMGARHDRYLFAGLSCAPCREFQCPFGGPCMGRLTPQDVVRQVAGLLGERVR